MKTSNRKNSAITNHNESLAKTLKLMRTYSGMKASDLADKIGISRSYISELESGKKPVTIQILKGYAKALDVPDYVLLVLDEKLRTKKGLEGKIFASVIKTIIES